MIDVCAILAELPPEEIELFLGPSLEWALDGSEVKQFCGLLTNFDFLEAKINHPKFGVQALIEDYDLIDDTELLTHPEYDAQTVNALKLIQGALRLSAHILNEDKMQLTTQLWGRLQCFEVSDIQAMLESAKQSKTTWLRPLTHSFDRPDERLLCTFIGHRDEVTSVAITPDGKQVISGSSDKTLKIWDMKTGKKLFTLEGHTKPITAIAVTPNGKRVISASEDKTLKVWDLQTAKETFTLNGHEDSVNAIAITSNCKQVISASSDATLRIWNLETGDGHCLFKRDKVQDGFISTSDNVQAVTIAHDDKWVISCWLCNMTYVTDLGGFSDSCWEIVIYHVETKEVSTLR